MSLQNLPVSRLINVGIVLNPVAAQSQNLSTLLILAGSAIIDVTERMRIYDSIAAVATDFGTSAAEYLAAVLWFEQAPQPAQLMIGRWASASTLAKLVGGALTTSEALIATWTAISNGGFTVTVDGGAAQHFSGINFSAVTNLNGVASAITTALGGLATMVYNAVYNRFELSSYTSGASSAISFLSAPTSGTDISATLAMVSTAGVGAYQAPGMVAETPLAAVTVFDQNFGQQWYAVTFLGAADPDRVAVAGYIEAANNKHIFGVSTQESGVISAQSNSDIAALLFAQKYTRTVGQYSSTTPHAVCSLLGRALTVNYGGQNTVITMMYKQEPGIVAETLTEPQITALEAKNFNVFVEYNNDTAIVEPGVMSSGDFIDSITGTDWLAVTIMTALYNLLFTSPSKIPQTDAGNHLLLTQIESVCSQAVTNGLLAPGVWDSAGFGGLSQGDLLPKGFYVFAPPVATQLAADRAARKSVAIQVAAKLAGAVHTVNVTINVNR